MLQLMLRVLMVMVMEAMVMDIWLRWLQGPRGRETAILYLPCQCEITCI
jgi:hypothetical protein